MLVNRNIVCTILTFIHNLQIILFVFDFYYQYHLQNQNPEDDSKYQTKHCRPI